MESLHIIPVTLPVTHVQMPKGRLHNTVIHGRISPTTLDLYTLYGWDPTVKTGQNIMMEERLMFSYIWPIALIVLSNVVYQICSKSIPEEVNPFASLTATYLFGAVASSILFYVFEHGGNLIHEYQKMNWAPFMLGIVIIGLEAGWIYAYRAGWPVSTGFIVQSAFLAIALIFVGYLLYHEALTWNKLVGVCICIIGLIFINLK